MFALIPTNQFKRGIKVLKKRSPKNTVLIIDFPVELENNGAAT
jgi:hypothetical protein